MLEKELTETKDQLFEGWLIFIPQATTQFIQTILLTLSSARQSNKRETELSASLQKELEFKETESNLLKQNLGQYLGQYLGLS